MVLKNEVSYPKAASWWACGGKVTEDKVGTYSKDYDTLGLGWVRVTESQLGHQFLQVNPSSSCLHAGQEERREQHPLV